MPASVEPRRSFPAVVVSRSRSVEPCSVLLATREEVLHCWSTSTLSPSAPLSATQTLCFLLGGQGKRHTQISVTSSSLYYEFWEVPFDIFISLKHFWKRLEYEWVLAYCEGPFNSRPQCAKYGLFLLLVAKSHAMAAPVTWTLQRCYGCV